MYINLFIHIFITQSNICYMLYIKDEDELSFQKGDFIDVIPFPDPDDNSEEEIQKVLL